MEPNTYPEISQATDLIQPLFEGQFLIKSVPEGQPDDKWSFRGIASDETEDETGDSILKKSLDLSYAQKRGFVNWDHSREPKDQLGYLTKAILIEGDMLKTLEDEFQVSLSKTASVYVEGNLYKHVEKAKDVRAMMKSSEPGRGPGLSLDGALARDPESKGVLRAFVRGVAITATPAHVMTLCSLKKSLRDYSLSLEKPEPEALSLAEEASLLKSDGAGVAQGLSFEGAVISLLRMRPHWTYDLAQKVVKHAIESRSR